MKRKRTPQPAKSPKPDIRAVASLARVSIATVSRVTSGLSTVDPALAARVAAAIRALHYIPNTQARSLVSGRSRLLGLIVSEITNPFFPELIQEFERASVARGYEILIASTSYDRQKMDLCVRRMMERKVDGVAIMTFGIEKLALDLFPRNDVPTVFIDSAPALPRSSVLSVDYRKGFQEAVQHLHTLGHTRIGFISGPRTLRSAEERRSAFTASLRSLGLKAVRSWLVEADHTLAGGRDAMHRLLALPTRPSALVCSNDMTAIGVQHAVFQAGLRIPADLSLIGFDDIHLSAYTLPPLTTIRMACADLAQAAVRQLLDQLQPQRHDPPQTGAPKPHSLIPTTLVIRQTTAAPSHPAR